MSSSSYLPYQEPDIVIILTQSAVLHVLNTVNHIFDSLILCGLIGQIFSVLHGVRRTPEGNLLNKEVELIVVQLDYLGLILLVYEGIS